MSDREFLWLLLGQLRNMRDRGWSTYDALVHDIARLAQETAAQLGQKAKGK